MELFEIIFIVFVLIGIILIPFLKKFIVLKFITLVLVAFIIGWLFDDIYTPTGMDNQSILLLILLIGGQIYNTIRFYKKHVA